MHKTALKAISKSIKMTINTKQEVNTSTLAKSIFEKTKISHRKKATLDLKNKLDDIF